MKRTRKSEKKVRNVPATRLAEVKGGACFTHGDVTIEVDEDGFMEVPAVWDETVEIAIP